MREIPCYRPYLAKPYGFSSKTGKVLYHFSRRLYDTSELEKSVVLSDGKAYPVKALPCGKCVGCRLDYSKEWAIRCTLEMQDYLADECFFLTLTYDNVHVPYGSAGKAFLRVDAQSDEERLENGEYWYESHERPPVQTLCSNDLQRFLKRLRRNQEYHYGKTFRYFACGEYGTKSMRPHYHLIVFGLKLPPVGQSDWKKLDKRGYSVWQSPYLEEIWKNGHVIVGRCTYETCGYVARYMLKKQKGQDAKFYEENGIEPPFSRMSLKPGLGMKYYEEHKEEMLSSDTIYIATEKRSIRTKPPRFFDLLMSSEFPDTFAQQKEFRSDLALKGMKAKEETACQPISVILENAERSRLASTKILQERNVVNV